MQNPNMTDLQRKYMLRIMRKNLQAVENKKWEDKDAKAKNIYFSKECIKALQDLKPIEAPKIPKIDMIKTYSNGKLMEQYVNICTPIAEPGLEGL